MKYLKGYKLFESSGEEIVSDIFSYLKDDGFSYFCQEFPCKGKTHLHIELDKGEKDSESNEFYVYEKTPFKFEEIKPYIIELFSHLSEYEFVSCSILNIYEEEIFKSFSYSSQAEVLKGIEDLDNNEEIGTITFIFIK